MQNELNHRIEEVAGYAVNIERFERMLAKIEAIPVTDPQYQALQDYARDQLAPRLEAERLNHRIACLTRDTIKDILEGR